MFLLCSSLFNMLLKLPTTKTALSVHSCFNNSINLSLNSKNNAYTKHNRKIFMSIINYNNTLGPFSLSLDQSCILNYLEIKSALLKKKDGIVDIYLYQELKCTKISIKLDSKQIYFNDIYHPLKLLDLLFTKKIDLKLSDKTNKDFICDIKSALQYYLDTHCDNYCMYGIYKNNLDSYVRDILDNLFVHKKYDYLYKLLGLGNGLTPAGDDCILGIISFIHIFDNYLQDNIKEQLHHTLDKLYCFLDKTNDISASMLNCGLNNIYNSSVINFLNIISQMQYDNFMSINNKLDCIKSYGHSSFYDYLLGFYLSICFYFK